MKKRNLLSFIILAAVSIPSPELDACTNVLVTKAASVDGSCMVSYAADSHQLFGELYYHPAASWGKDSVLDVVEWDTGRYLGPIPQVPYTYQTVGNMNEHQLIIAETTFGGRPELYGRDGKMDYGSMEYIALQRAKTAREAIKIMVDLANEHGYLSSGESFSIADTQEVWLLEVVGKGPGCEGILWVARRVPDGYICAHANQSRISTFPLNDPENCMYAPDVITFAREKGWFSGKDKDFSFCDTYAPLDFGAMRGCEARAWSAFNILCDGKFTYMDEKGREVTRDANDFLDYAMGYDKSKRFPLFVKPSRKISVKDVADVMRDHYEGTPMDMRKDIGAGGNALPYRWRPMDFEWDGKTYTNERAIATQQTGFWFVAQSRGYLPDEIGGVLWFAVDDAATSYLTPVYTCITDVPESFRVGNGNMLKYSPTSAFWMCNRVSNACYKAYNLMEPLVREQIDSWETEKIAQLPSIDKVALSMHDAGNLDGVRDYLTYYTLTQAAEIFARWTALEELLLVKFIDGNVKAQNPDGSFVTNGNSDVIPGGISQPGYTDEWKRVVAKEHGNVIEVK